METTHRNGNRLEHRPFVHQRLITQRAISKRLNLCRVPSVILTFLRSQKCVLTAGTQPGFMFAQNAIALTPRQYLEQGKLRLFFYGGRLLPTRFYPDSSVKAAVTSGEYLPQN